MADTLSAFAAEQSVALTRFAYLLCADHGTAEDLVQDVFLALYRRYGDALPPDAPIAYARKSIVHAYLSWTRKWASTEVPTDMLPEASVPPPDLPGQDAVWAALLTLPTRQRTVLVCRYYLDIADPEIARILGCRRGTVRSLAARAFFTLRTDSSLTEEGL